MKFHHALLLALGIAASLAVMLTVVIGAGVIVARISGSAVAGGVTMGLALLLDLAGIIWLMERK